jgi:hypothetical protein
VAATARRRVIVDWDAAERVFDAADGTPTRISVNRWIDSSSPSAPNRPTP